MTRPGSEKPIPFYLGVFLLCASVLMLQVVQTRILSVVSMYYSAFLSISMAMLGLTAGALIVYFRESRFGEEGGSRLLAKLCALYSLVIAGSFLLQLTTPLPIVYSATFVLTWLKMILLLAAPFVVAGMAVSFALTRSPFRVGVVYGVDLAGAAFGCLGVLGVLHLLDAPSAIFAIAALAALAALGFARSAPGPRVRTWSRPGWIALGMATLAIANATTQYGLQPISVKNRIDARQAYEFEQWNSFSRVNVGKSQADVPALWGPSPRRDHTVRLDQRHLTIDGFAGTVMPRFSGNPDEVAFLRHDVTNLAYYARRSGRAAVVGVGSGRDVLSAHLFGFRDITGVELNPIFIDLLSDKDKLRGYAGLADLPGVRLIADEGRSWFARSAEKFDLIQMSMIDTFASTGVGAFSLSENGLYTVEGWRIFLSALTPTGLFTVSRWHSPTAAVEIGRSISLAMAALFSLGAERPREHIFIASSGALATLVVSPQRLSAADVKTLSDAASELQYSVLLRPDREPSIAMFRDLLSARDIDDLNVRAGGYPLDVSAPTDARPFFFNQLRVSHLGDVATMLEEYRRTGTLIGGTGLVVVGNLIAIGTLLLVIVLSSAVVVATIVLPAVSAVSQTGRPLALAGTAYFLLIGLGFMFVEIGLIQRISIFLGHPIYALSIGLFSIILSAGIGSMLSERASPRSPAQMLTWLLVLGVYLVLLPSWLPLVTQSDLETRSLLTRGLASVAIIFPAGILMGYGFPTGMRLVMAIDPKPTPWFWGINGAAGVLAAGTAVACSIAFSIDVTLRAGGVCYLALAPVALFLLGTGRAHQRVAATAS
jgi:hypothetical protein